MLSGKFRNYDAAMLMLYLREHEPNGVLIKDIGHFLAHPTRNRDITVEALTDFFYHARFIMEALGPDGIKIELNNMPALLPRLLQGSFNKQNDPTFREAFKQSKKSMRPVLKKLLARFEENGKGGLFLRPENTPTIEIRLLDKLVSTLSTHTAFSGRDCFEDFRRALLKHDLLKESEAEKLGIIQDQFVLFVVSVLHLKTAVLKDGTKVDLFAGVESKKHNHEIAVTARSRPDPQTHSFPLGIGFTMMDTSLIAHEHVEPYLVCGLPPDGDLWGCPIELSSDGQLVLIPE